MTKLNQMFSEFVIKASELRATKTCGLKFWRDIKESYDITNHGLNFKKNAAYAEITDLFKSGQLSNKDNNGETIVPDHFIYQMSNIPTNEHVSIRKVMQLALNAGQWKSAEKNTPALREADRIFNEHALDNIDSYLELHDSEKLSRML